MKILLFTKMNFGNAANGGIFKKVKSQARALAKHGLEVDLFYFKNQTFYVNEEIVFEAKGKFSFLWFLYVGFFSRLQIPNYHGVYIRHFLINPLFLLVLARMKRKGLRLFMELPTFPYKFEYSSASLGKKLGLYIDQVCAPFLRFYVHKIITFSFYDKIYGIETIKSDNAIDPEIFEVLDKPVFEGDLHLLAVANVQVWHGYDRIIRGLAEYTGEIPVIFHLVGGGAELQQMKDLASKINVMEKIVFHNFLSGSELDFLYHKAHIGLGSFGMHRIGVGDGQTSTLKAREYAIKGLPMVLGHKDRGFPKNYPYVLELPATEEPIEIQVLVDFFNSFYTKKNYTYELHSYAKENLNWVKTLEEVANRFKEK